MAVSSDTSQGCKHQASNGHTKGEETQSSLDWNPVRVGSQWMHSARISLRTLEQQMGLVNNRVDAQARELSFLPIRFFD